MVKKIRKNFAVVVLIACALFFYYPLLFFFKLPIPSDTIIGLYHPYRDLYAQQYPNGLPFKNFLITDPVRQTYIWKELAVGILSNGEVPSWNPYEMAGKPLAANIQTGAFYPLNIILFLKPFHVAWSIFIAFQTVMALIFSYFYLRNLKLDQLPSIVGALAFGFSGFGISWLEWGNILHTVVWLPLILLAIDKILTEKRATFWKAVFVLSLSASLLAGHLQSFFYLSLLSSAYFILRWIESGLRKRSFVQFLALMAGVLVLTVPQWLPALRFINLSARSMDQNFSEIPGWFLPWQNLIQFIAPDFFGNPTTLNYYGVWNYAEFVGYIGIVTLAFAFTAFYKRNSTVIFFSSAALISLVFALPTGISSLPFVLDLPFISTAQPSRLIFIVSFSLSILAAIGFQFYQDDKKKFKAVNIAPFVVVAVLLGLLWLVSSLSILFFSEVGQSEIARRNLVFPTVILTAGLLLVALSIKMQSKRIRSLLFALLLLVIFADSMRFANKFTPFTDKSYLFPDTKALDYLKSQEGVFRIASNDNRILAPNFATYYRLQSIEGYDPLYLNNYADYIAAMEQNLSNPSKPYGFNRIITPHNYKSPLFDFLNVKYLLSLTDIEDGDFRLVLREGETRVYENINFMERAFFVENVIEGKDLGILFTFDMSKSALVEEYLDKRQLTVGVVEIKKYSENEIIVRTQNGGDGFLVMSDTYYPTWKVFIDGQLSKIYKANHAFRGVFVPAGDHEVIMRNYLF